MPTPEEWAWLAGIFEGEGTAVLRATSSATIAIAMTDPDVVRRIDVLVPCPGGIKERPSNREGHKRRYEWLLCRKVDVVPFLQGILPWLGERRSSRALEVLARLERCHGSEDWGVRCKRGHLLEGENLYVVPSTQRKHCRTCDRDNAQRRYQTRQRNKI